MREFIEKKMRSAKVFRIVLLVIAVLWIGSFFLIPNLEFKVYYPIVMLLTLSVITCGIIYIVAWMPITRSVKWLRSKGMENVADDIVLDSPTLPSSKIYCGQRALFCKKPCAVIPYSEIAWVHLYKRTAYGVITVEKAVIVYTKDGRKFHLNSDADEFKWLLENYIIQNSPNVVIGYGAEQKARYKQLNAGVNNYGNRVKRIWGIVLMAMGTALLILLLFTYKNAEIVPLIIMIAGLLGSGGILYFLGKKK